MKRRAGFTLVEVTIAAGILLMVLTGATLLMSTAARGLDRTSALLDADRAASQAVQHMMLDLEEAKQVTVLSSTSMRVYFPQVDSSGRYIRSALDTVNTIDYFLGTANLTASSTGTYLVRSPAGGTARAICSGVTFVQFTSTNPSSVDIQLRTQRTTPLYQSVERDMIHRAIFLRNY